MKEKCYYANIPPNKVLKGLWLTEIASGLAALLTRAKCALTARIAQKVLASDSLSCVASSCSITNCRKCYSANGNGLTRCQKCKTGFTVDDSYNCVSSTCTISYCTTCKDSSSCAACTTNYKLSADQTGCIFSATTPTVSSASNPVTAALVWMVVKPRTASLCWALLKVWWLIEKSVSLWPPARTVKLVSCWPTLVLPAS